MQDELRPFGIQVQTINPGPFLTGFNDRMFKTWESWEDDPSQRLFDYAKLAFHESLHNVWPAWHESDLMGHGGLADTPVGADLGDWDKDTFRRGVTIKSTAKQQL